MLINEIKKLFYNSVADFLVNDKDMYKDCSERSKVHRIAHYLENYIRNNKIFNGYVVDCEYNRVKINDKIDSKRLPKEFHGDDKHNGCFMPDLIVHKRNTNENLLYCELKNKEESDIDKEKISLLTDGKFEIQYLIGATINFEEINIDNYESKIKFFENKKISLMKQIHLSELEHVLNFKNKKIINVIFRMLRDNSEYTLYDLAFMTENELLKVRGLGKQSLSVFKEIRELSYEGILSIFNEIHKYDNFTEKETISILNDFFQSKDEIQLIGNCNIQINNKLFWDLFINTENGNTINGFARSIGIEPYKFNSFFLKFKRYLYRNDFFRFIKMFNGLLNNYKFSIYYIYTYKEIEVFFGNDALMIAKYIKFLTESKVSWKYDSIYDYDYELMVKEVKEKGGDVLVQEIREGKYLSNNDKELFCSRYLNKK